MGLKITDTNYCDHCRRIVMEPKDLICFRVSKRSLFDQSGPDDRFLEVCLDCFHENSAADMIPDFDYRGIDHATFDRCRAASSETGVIQLSTLNC
jgi:hypothetical protein